MAAMSLDVARTCAASWRSWGSAGRRRASMIDSDLPRGAGLSSSAALTLAVALALGADARDPLALARLGQRVEHVTPAPRPACSTSSRSCSAARGTPCGSTSATLEWRHVPLDLGDWRLALIDSGAVHSHAESGYNERRAECQAAAERLGLESLSDATPRQAIDLPEPLGRRVRHVLSENARVDAVVQALGPRRPRAGRRRARRVAREPARPVRRVRARGRGRPSRARRRPAPRARG